MSTTTLQQGNFIQHCLESIPHLIPGTMGTFYLLDDQLNMQQHFLRGIPAEMHQCYLRDFQTIDPYHPQHFNHLPINFVPLDEATRSSAYFRKFVGSYQMRDVVEIYVRRNRRIVGGVSLLRDTQFSASEVMRLRALVPLIEVATLELLPEQPQRRLTRKEQVIVELIRDGACNKRIASQLDISLSTVKTHLRNLFHKAEATNRTELLRNVNASWVGYQADQRSQAAQTPR